MADCTRVPSVHGDMAWDGRVGAYVPVQPHYAPTAAAIRHPAGPLQRQYPMQHEYIHYPFHLHPHYQHPQQRTSSTSCNDDDNGRVQSTQLRMQTQSQSELEEKVSSPTVHQQGIGAHGSSKGIPSVPHVHERFYSSPPRLPLHYSKLSCQPYQTGQYPSSSQVGPPLGSGSVPYDQYRALSRPFNGALGYGGWYPVSASHLMHPHPPSSVTGHLSGTYTSTHSNFTSAVDESASMLMPLQETSTSSTGISIRKGSGSMSPSNFSPLLCVSFMCVIYDN